MGQTSGRRSARCFACPRPGLDPDRRCGARGALERGGDHGGSSDSRCRRHQPDRCSDMRPGKARFDRGPLRDWRTAAGGVFRRTDRRTDQHVNQRGPCRVELARDLTGRQGVRGGSATARQKIGHPVLWQTGNRNPWREDGHVERCARPIIGTVLQDATGNGNAVAYCGHRAGEAPARAPD
jgi:hypothetical protein